MSKLIINELDYTRIKRWISDAKQHRSINSTDATKLLEELESAKIVKPEKVPADVVTMNSIVKLSFLNNNSKTQFQIVYPNQANFNEKKVSIFSPIAIALIGYQVNDEIEWVVPSGLTKIKIDEIVYQPEAAGDYNL